MAVTRRSLIQPRCAVALYRVSTAEQGHSGLGLKHSRRASAPSSSARAGR